MKLKRAAIFSLSFLTIMATDTVAPLLNQISASFPDVSPTLIRQTITLPSFLAIFFGLIAGQLVKIISKKAVLAIALVMYAVGGIAGGWSKSFTNHLLLRALLGAGTGMIAPIVSSLIADFYTGKQRADMIGYSSAVSHFGGVVTPPLAAFLGAQNWRNAFFIYGITPLVLIFVLLSIPKSSQKRTTQSKADLRTPIAPVVYWLSVVSFFIIVVFFIIITDIPFLIASKPGMAAYVTTFGLAISTFGSTISGLLFSRIYSTLKKWIVPAGLLICAAGFLLTTYTQNSAMALFGLLCTGIGLGFLVSLTILITANSSKEKDSTAALAFLNSAFSVGMFASPFFYAIVPGWITVKPDIVFNFQFASTFFLAIGIISIPLVSRFMKNSIIEITR